MRNEEFVNGIIESEQEASACYNANPSENSGNMSQGYRTTVFRNAKTVQIGGYSVKLFTEEDRAVYGEILERLPYNNDLDQLMAQFKAEESEQTESDDHLFSGIPFEKVEQVLIDPVSFENEIVEKERLQMLERFLNTRLTKVQCNRIRMFFYEGLSEEEIAEIEGATQQSVSESIRRAIIKLRKVFKEAGYHVQDI